MGEYIDIGGINSWYDRVVLTFLENEPAAAAAMLPIRRAPAH